jgi:hypothetical protein
MLSGATERCWRSSFLANNQGVPAAEVRTVLDRICVLMTKITTGDFDIEKFSEILLRKIRSRRTR